MNFILIYFWSLFLGEYFETAVSEMAVSNIKKVGWRIFIFYLCIKVFIKDNMGVHHSCNPIDFIWFNQSKNKPNFWHALYMPSASTLSVIKSALAFSSGIALPIATLYQSSVNIVISFMASPKTIASL